MELLFVSIYTIAESFRLGSAIFPKNSSESILAADFGILKGSPSVTVCV
jgi:hypothetical protein